MNTFGIRQAKAHLSALVRAAGDGECSFVTDNGKLVAMIGPLPEAPVEAEGALERALKTPPLSGAAAFRRALLSAPYPFDLDF